MKTESRYPSHSWVDARIEVRDSEVEGKGLFVKEPINEGEVVEKFGGQIFTEEDIQAEKHRPHSLLAIDEGLYLGLPKDSTEVTIDEYTNHSCDPSAWLIDEVTLVARHDLQAGDEITMDYATWEPDEEYIYFTDCKCGTALCRHLVTGHDWRREDLQKRYSDHFSPFIQKRIDNLSNCG